MLRCSDHSGNTHLSLVNNHNTLLSLVSTLNTLISLVKTLNTLLPSFKTLILFSHWSYLVQAEAKDIITLLLQQSAMDRLGTGSALEVKEVSLNTGL